MIKYGKKDEKVNILKNYMFIVEYDGTKYNGWQRLQNGIEKSIQGKIEILLSRLLEENIEIIGSGRTDAGVHALMQSCNFKTSKTLNENFVKECNRYLPEDIRIKSLNEVDERFHSRFNVKNKTYMYRIDNSQFGDPFIRKYSFHIEKKLNVEKINRASKMFLGEHDFKAFSKNNGKKKSTIKSIDNIQVKVNGDIIEFYFEAKGFLYNMVRMIMGTLIQIGLEEIELEHINKLFEDNNRENFRYTAPPHGLFLYKVEY